LKQPSKIYVEIVGARYNLDFIDAVEALEDLV
jgi:hypothetical protein